MNDTERIARLDAIRERVEAASAGPWYHDPQRDWIYGGIYSTPGDHYPPELHCGSQIMAVLYDELHGTEADGEFLAHAREDIPWLLAELAKISCAHGLATAVIRHAGLFWDEDKKGD